MIDEIWTMKNGREILVSEMSTEHIRNARRMVSKLQSDDVMAGCIFMGDAAQDALDSNEREAERWIDIFTQELKRRESIE